MAIENAADNSQEEKLIKIMVSIFICSLLFLLLSNTAGAFDKTQALKNLENLVNNPEKAREERRKIKNLSKEELKKFDELREIFQKEIETMSSSLPTSIDRYTTMYAAIISGNNVLFRYTLSNNMPGIEDKNELMLNLTAMIKNGICTSPVGAYLILGYICSYYYFDENSEYIGGVIVDAETCGFE
jgi:hypothetical protein